MSNKNKEPQAKAQQHKQAQVKSQEIPKGEKKYLLNDLREHCQNLFGVKPEVFDGAFYKEKESKVSKEHAKSRIKSFLNKEVKQ